LQDIVKRFSPQKSFDPGSYMFNDYIIFSGFLSTGSQNPGSIDSVSLNARIRKILPKTMQQKLSLKKWCTNPETYSQKGL